MSTPDKTLRLTSDVEEIRIKPHFDGQLSVRIVSDGFDRNHQACAATVHGDGRMDLYAVPAAPEDAINTAWTRELVKAARDLHRVDGCLLEGQACIAHHWHGEGRCPQARLGDILAALERTEWKATP